MHIHTLEKWQHSHHFLLIEEKGERRTLQVLLLTIITMAVEIIAGELFRSMALLADGWHMGTHVAAFAITIFAYRYARRHADDPSFSFGTGKVSVLGGFASTVALLVVALVMALESVHRLFDPQPIHFTEAITVAVIGLVINLLSALLLQQPPHHHDHEHNHDHHHDHNLRAAYVHVLADALTSVLAIIALLSGKLFGGVWMDAIMGIVGAAVITRWSFGLLKDTSAILLDRNLDEEQKAAIITAIERDSDNRVADLHLWKVSSAHFAAIISIVTHYPKDPNYYKSLLSEFHDVPHIVVEVNPCHETPCLVI